MTASNRLQYEKSPYLLQHADNPIHWHAWNDDAFQRARDLDRPIFLSIGYSSCHWCHVMEHESFEDDDVAAILNDNFVAIKVDREERPDIDEIYMTACQAMTGAGGWPLTIIMTPDGEPFFAGTYIPKTERFGRRGLIDLLKEISDKWRTERDKIVALGGRVRQHLSQLSTVGTGRAPGEGFLRAAVAQAKGQFDSVYGGFGGAPKFPIPHRLTALIRWLSREEDPELMRQVSKTLRAMRWGGMYDQLGFGFHRYSTDSQWLVPHFEKMLYDNAGLAMAYTEMFQLTGEDEWRQTATEIFTYVLRDMTSADGAFYSAEDADSEGEEGTFYIWDASEFDHVLDREMANLARRFWGVTERGNFENSGKTVLFQSRTVEEFAEETKRPSEEILASLNDARNKLYVRRETREHPFKDDKVLTAWNGLMIAALAKAGQAFGDQTYTAAAERAARFLLDHMRDKDGRLLRRYRDGDAAIRAFSDDYAFMIWGLIELYEATFKTAYLRAALALNDELLQYFWDNTNGGLFLYSSDGEPLLTRPKEYYDGALPSANSVAALNLLRLARMTGQTGLEERSNRVLESYAAMMQQSPMNFMQAWWAVDFAVGPSQEVVVVGDDLRFTEELRTRYMPRKVLIGRGQENGDIVDIAPYVKTLLPIDGKTAVYICEGFQCQLPIKGLESLRQQLDEKTVKTGG